MIPTLTICIAILGAVLLIMLAVRLRNVNDDYRLKKHRSTAPSVADLLGYAAMIDDGVIVCKNGSLMAAWLYTGADNASSTDEQREILSVRINQAFTGLGSGWMIHVDAVRRPAASYPDASCSAFPDPVSTAIEEERRQLFGRIGVMYEGYFVVTLTWFPPMLAQRKFVELMFDDDVTPPDHKSRTNTILKQFKRDVSAIENRLSVALKLQPLHGKKMVTEDGRTITHDEFLSWLQFCISGVHNPVVLPSNPMYLDTIIGGKELWGGVVPKIGNKFVQVISIEGFPLESTPGMLSALAEMPFPYRWSNRFIFMDQHEAVEHLNKFRKKWKQKIRGIISQIFNTNAGTIDQDALSMVNDAESAIAEVNSCMVSAGYYTSVIVLMGEDRESLETNAKYVEKSIGRLGFIARIETINTLDAFFGSLPGHGVENVRRPLINTLNLADLLPTSTIWTGSQAAPCPWYPPLSPALMHCVTTGSTPFRLNLHVNDLGHTLMFGPTGAGKSTHLAMIAAQFRRYKNCSIFAFDKGLSLYPLVKAVGGSHFAVATDDDSLSFCPLQFLSSKSDIAFAAEWIDSILSLNGVITTPSQRNEITHALRSMHSSGSKTISEFCITVQDIQIRDALKQYTVDGAMGHLLDAAEDGLSFSDFTTFEIEELMNLGDKYCLPVLMYIFRRIELSLKGQPAMIILDEAWIMFGHPVFREKIREWLKVMRKANCLVLMATQSLTDAANSGILDVMVESTATKIFLPNIYARDEDTAALYRRMGLNARQIDILASAIPKRQYYYVSENGRRLYDMALGPIALSFVGSSDKESLAIIRQMVAKYGNDWVHEWLKSKELSLNNYSEVA